MRKLKVWILLSAIVASAVVACGQSRGTVAVKGGKMISSVQESGRITVTGDSLASRLDETRRRARSAAKQGRFRVGYAFDVRPGIAVNSDASVKVGGMSIRGLNVEVNPRAETRNVGVFLLYEANGNVPVKLDIQNLDQHRAAEDAPIYWLDRAKSAESLELLRRIAEAGQAGNKVVEHAVVAIAIHNDPKVREMLEEFVRHSQVEEVRETAVTWLDQFPGAEALLMNVARDEKESAGVRLQAIVSLGKAGDDASLAALQKLYTNVSARKVKHAILDAVSQSENEDPAVAFLLRVVGNEADRGVKHHALTLLSEKAVQHNAPAGGSDVDTAIQEQAVEAIARRPKDEAVPLLIKIARTHPKPSVRKEAIIRLGEIGDERAVEFFKELFTR